MISAVNTKTNDAYLQFVNLKGSAVYSEDVDSLYF